MSAQLPPLPPKPFQKLASLAVMMVNSAIGAVGVRSRYLIQAEMVRPFAIGDVAALVMSSAPAVRDMACKAPSIETA